VIVLGGGSSDMVAVLEMMILVACVVLGVWWFSRTSRFRARNSRLDHRDEQKGYGRDGTRYWQG
jgi:hypothetical protein